MTSPHFLSLHIWDNCILHPCCIIVNPNMQHFFNFF
nr:MAG TPA: Hexapeptide repeat of succinyl-transferase [Caudoviricetes sp.]